MDGEHVTMLAEAGPKHDHIADAVLSLAARNGIDSVSLRRVAREAGVSMGQVQYYFGTTSDMLYFTVVRTLSELAKHFEAFFAGLKPSNDPIAWLYDMTRFLITDDPEVKWRMRYLAQFEMRLEKDERINVLMARNDPNLQRQTAAAFASARDMGVVIDSIDPEKEAAVYWQMLGALSIEVSLGITDASTGHSIMDYHLDRLRAR